MKTESPGEQSERACDTGSRRFCMIHVICGSFELHHLKGWSHVFPFSRQLSITYTSLGLKEPLGVVLFLSHLMQWHQ